MSETSTKPCLVRAIYEWRTDSGFTPYIAVFVGNSADVLREFVKNDEIVLSVNFDATSQLDTGNEWITSHAHFSGVSREIEVPVEDVLAVYARGDDQGMASPMERSTPTTQAAIERENSPPPKLATVDSGSASTSVPAEAETGPKDEPTPPNVPHIGRKPALKIVKWCVLGQDRGSLPAQPIWQSS